MAAADLQQARDQLQFVMGELDSTLSELLRAPSSEQVAWASVCLRDAQSAVYAMSAAIREEGEA